MIQWTINTVSNHERERKDASYNGGHKKKPIMRETEMEEEREREREREGIRPDRRQQCERK